LGCNVQYKLAKKTNKENNEIVEPKLAKAFHGA
jgi:hypothetical protein